jgi:hypothetical protein
VIPGVFFVAWLQYDSIQDCTSCINRFHIAKFTGNKDAFYTAYFCLLVYTRAFQ